jgi:hypothetical protein
MKHSTKFLALVLMISASCEFSSNEANNPDSPDRRFITPLEPERLLNPVERARLVRLCESGQSARERLDTLFDRELIFSFDFRQRECGNEEFGQTSQVMAELRKPFRGQPTLEGLSNALVIGDFFTDRHPLLNDICAKAFAGEEIPNTWTAQTNDERLQFTVGNVQNHDGIQITRFTPNREGNWQARSIDNFVVVTGITTSNRSRHGEVFERSQTLPCSEGQQSQTRFQRLRSIQRR